MNSRQLSSSLLSVFLLSFCIYSPYTSSDIQFEGIFLTTYALMAVLSVCYGIGYWRQQMSYLPDTKRERLRYLLIEIMRGCGIAIALLAIASLLLVVVMSVGGEYSMQGLRSLSVYRCSLPLGAGLFAVLALVGTASEMFWRGYIYPAFAEMMTSLLPWERVLLAAVCPALVVVPTLQPIWIGAIFLLHLPLTILYNFRPQWLVANIVAHALFSATFFFIAAFWAI